MKKNSVLLALFMCVISFNALSSDAPAALKKSFSSENAQAYIIEPKNGAVVGKTFTVKFGLRGMDVAPAGVDKDNSGHHHLIIDGTSLPDFNKPMGKEVRHFGGGQTETTLSLSPGKHTLQLILGDKNHVPHQPPVISEKITLTVK